MCECKIGPGKYEGEPALTFLAWQAVLEGMQDQTTGSDENGDLMDWIKAPLGLLEAEAIEAALEYGYCRPCIDAAEKGIAGVGVWVSGQGFVGSMTFETVEAYEKAIREAEASQGVEDEPGEEVSE